jgi:Holliday junction resolvasome RuvABC DNA-binding subunit
MAASPVEDDVVSALVNLGYQRPLAEKVMAKLGKTDGESFEVLFRRALAGLSK